MAIRMNRGERTNKFLSNIVPGEATQLTPNGVSLSSGGEAPTMPGVTIEDFTGGELRVKGARSGVNPPIRTWSGNRSGE